MNIADEKKKFISCLKKVQGLSYIKVDDMVNGKLIDLANDVKKDMFTVVVLGEFKRGKSTFINALLGVDLLSTDVLPETATINALMYSDKPVVQVVYYDGTHEDNELSEKFLKQFSAQLGQEKFKNIKYLKIGYPSDLLKNNIVFVDTPGVSDVNELSCEVTYRFIPKANAVIFLLDANSPLKKTEKDFIEEKLLPMGLDKIIFVLNKYDAVDEEEEGDVVNNVKKRITEAFKDNSEGMTWFKNIIVCPLSAKDALEGRITSNSQLIASSGIVDVENKIKMILSDGRIEQEKLRNYKHRFVDIVNDFCDQCENKKMLKAMSKGELNKLSEQVQSMLDSQGESRNKIKDYVQLEVQNIKSLCSKSVHYFENQITKDTIDEINIYHGADFKNYVEERVTLSLQRKFESWVAAYMPQVDKLLADMQKELSHGLSYSFQQKIVITTNIGVNENGVTRNSYKFRFTSKDTSGATAQAGMIGAGMYMVANMMGAPMIMPVIGMAALPLLRERILESKIAAAKAQVLPLVKEQIQQGIERLKHTLFKFIDEGASLIVSNTEQYYDSILEDVQKSAIEQLEPQNNDKMHIEKEITQLTSQINELRGIMVE